MDGKFVGQIFCSSLSLFRLSEWTEHESGFGEFGGLGGGLSGWVVGGAVGCHLGG